MTNRNLLMVFLPEMHSTVLQLSTPNPSTYELFNSSYPIDWKSRIFRGALSQRSQAPERQPLSLCDS